jgi:NTE family protein
VVREGNRTVLNVLPVEKSWGPDYLRFGVNLATDFQSQADYNLRALYRRTWLNSYGGEWRVGLQIGSEQFITTEFYQPLDHSQHTFIRPFGFFDSRLIGLYNDGDRFADYTFHDARVGAEVGLNIGIYGQARLGWVHRWLNFQRDTGPAIFPDFKDRVAGPTFNVVLDTEDQAYFPTRGFQGRLDYFDAMKATGDNGTKYAKLSGGLEGVYSIRDVSLIGEIEGGDTTKGTLPVGDLFSLGGPRRLSAFANDQLLGGQYEYGRIEAQWRLTKPIPLLGLNIIAGAIAEAGRMRKSATELALEGVWLQSYGVYIAANTFLGPVYFGYSDSKKGEGRFYLFVGTP